MLCLSPPLLLDLCLSMVIGRCCWKLLKSFLEIFTIFSPKNFHFCMTMIAIGYQPFDVQADPFYLLGNCDTLSLEQDHKNSRV